MAPVESSMSGKLWVWFLCFFESGYREVAFERPLLATPQSYLCGQGARTRLAREDAHYPRPSLHLFEEALQHVRRAYPGMVASRVAKIAQSVLYSRLEDRNRFGIAPLVERDELLRQRLGRLLPPDLEDRLEILRNVRH